MLSTEGTLDELRSPVLPLKSFIKNKITPNFSVSEKDDLEEFQSVLPLKIRNFFSNEGRFRGNIRPFAGFMPMFSGKARHLFPEITYIEGKISDNWEETPVAEGESGAESF